MFKAQTKVSEEQTQGPLCNLLSSCIEQNVLHITGNEQTGELTAGNGRKVNIIGNEQLKNNNLLSIPIYYNNNSYPVQRYTRYELVLLLNSAMVVCTNWASNSDDTFVVSVARLWQCALYGRGENELGITTSMLVNLLKLIWTGCSSLVLFIPLLAGQWPTEQQKMDRNKQNFEEENQTFQ